MGFWSSVCSFAKAAVSCVLGGFSSLAINAVSSVCSFIGKFLGVMKEKDNLEDLGERSLQAEESGIRPENYQKFEDYQKAIDNFEIDPKKKHRPEDCLNRGIDHVNLASKMKMPELNLEAVINYLGKVDGEGFFNQKNLDSILNTCKTEPNFVNNILGVLNKTEKDQNVLSNTINKMVEIEKTNTPNITEKEALRKIFNNQVNED
ncbi:MAG: hypothetical protein MR366_00950 [Succinivibrio sp.]|nr:hypothetical protein [Succinivibrio sp.]